MASIGQRVDLWLALLAGPPSWVDPDDRPTLADGATAAIQAVALLALVSWMAVDPDGPAGKVSVWRSLAVAVTLLALFAALAGPTLVWALSHRRAAARLSAHPRASAIIRGLLAVAAVALWFFGAPQASVAAAWPFGVAAGCEACLSAWAIGYPVKPFQWWRRFLQSGPHLGAVVALLAFVGLRGMEDTARIALTLYATLHLVIAVTVATIVVLSLLRRRGDTEIERRQQHVMAAEARRRANWLHDEVCTRLGFVQRQLEGGLPADHVAGELRALDHALRERQLDELLGAGPVELAEVVQPYLRMAQQQNVRVVGVPRYEDTSVVLDADTARLAKRALANLVGNAIKAGARELAVRVHHDQDEILILEVEDDAGGFAAEQVEPGRGLDRLRAELGRDNLTMRTTERGTLAIARIKAEPPSTALPPRTENTRP